MRAAWVSIQPSGTNFFGVLIIVYKALLSHIARYNEETRREVEDEGIARAIERG